MDNPGTVALSRQTGLTQAMTTVANNIANMSTTGYRREGLVFAELVRALPPGDGSIAMTGPRAGFADEAQGPIAATGGAFDLAIEGAGYFAVEGADGPLLTRAGAFTRSVDGALVDPAGRALLDPGGAPVFAPPGAERIVIDPGGALLADDQPVSQVGLFTADPTTLARVDGVAFRSTAEPEPAEGGRILQGFLEGSNVNPMAEMARMIEVQRAYELGQGFMEREDERIRAVVRTLGETR